MKLYKLTNKNMETYQGFKWEINKEINLPKIENPKLCSPDVIHAYVNLNLAFLLNPIHSNITDPLCFEADGIVCVTDYGKVGCFNLVLNEEISPPEWTMNSDTKQKVQIQFGILCADSVLGIFTKKFPDDKRPMEAIAAARKYLNTNHAIISYDYADAAYAAAADAAYAAAAYAAYAAADAAYAASAAADAAYAASAAAYAASAAAYATHAASYATHAASYAAANINFSILADMAVEMIITQNKTK